MSNAAQISFATLEVACRGQAKDTFRLNIFDESGNLEIVWPKGMSPFGDAVSFANRNHSDCSVANHFLSVKWVDTFFRFDDDHLAEIKCGDSPPLNCRAGRSIVYRKPQNIAIIPG